MIVRQAMVASFMLLVNAYRKRIMKHLAITAVTSAFLLSSPMVSAGANASTAENPSHSTSSELHAVTYTDLIVQNPGVFTPEEIQEMLQVEAENSGNAGGRAKSKCYYKGGVLDWADCGILMSRGETRQVYKALRYAVHGGSTACSKLPHWVLKAACTLMANGPVIDWIEKIENGNDCIFWRVNPPNVFLKECE